MPPGVADAAGAARLIFNDRLDAAVAAFFMVSVVVILLDSMREWRAVLSGRKPMVSSEVAFVRR
jgi:carbon starvation protein